MPKPTREQVRVFQDVYPQLQEVLATMGDLAKKRPNDPVNTFKLKHINEILQKVNGVLGPAYRPFKEFGLFELEGELMTSSDVVMILRQYIIRMDKWRSDHTVVTYDEENYPGMNVPTGSRWDTSD